MRKCLSHNEILDFSTVQHAQVEGTSPVKSTTGRSTKKSARRARRKAVCGGRSWSSGLVVSGDGDGVVAHAGNVATRLLADQVGLTGALSGAMAWRGFTPTHDRGRVLVDVAVLIAVGGEAIADIDVLRHQSEVLGSVASAPTVWRARHELDEVTPAVAKRIDKARATVRAHVWSQLPGGLPASRVADTDQSIAGDTVVLDVDATLVTTHSEKKNAASTFKRGFGYHPLGVWCDNTQESMTLMLRPGNAGSNTASRQHDSHRRPDRGHRPGPDGAPQEPVDPGRRSRRLPRVARLAHHRLWA